MLPTKFTIYTDNCYYASYDIDNVQQIYDITCTFAFSPLRYLGFFLEIKQTKQIKQTKGQQNVLLAWSQEI